jgi:hypothetical protein
MSESDEIAHDLDTVLRAFGCERPVTFVQAQAIVLHRLGPDQILGAQHLDNIAEELLRLAQEDRP